MGIEKKLGKWAFEGQAELRLKDNAGTVDRTGIGVGASYRLLKPLTVGAAYQYFSHHDAKYDDYQPRQRYIAFVQANQHFGNFSLSLRERFQRTVKDESDRLRESGTYDTYKVNPEWSWRNRLKLGYDIPQSAFSPSLSVETFYQLNNPDGNEFTKIRSVLSLDYNLAKRHKIEVYGLMDKELNVDSPLTRFVTGCGYRYSF